MQEFLDYLSSLNFSIPSIQLDGKIHRFDRNGKQNAWYIGWQNHSIKTGNSYVVCKFGDWKTSEDHLYKPSTSNISKEDSKAIEEQLKESALRQKVEKETAQIEVSNYAKKTWDDIAKMPRGTSSYLERKKIKEPPGILINHDGVIFIPMSDVNGKLWGYQRIFKEKDELGRDKKFVYRQKTSGTMFVIGELNEETPEVMLCEGFATGCTIHEVTGITTVCAFNADNLKNIAKDLHLKYTSLMITVCADDDRFTETGNVGVTKATQAAELCNGILKIPQWTKDDHRGTDFNDLFCFEGEAICKEQFDVKEEPKTGFFPLGYETHTYYFYSVANKDIVKINSFTHSQMYSLAPRSYWFANYPNKSGVAWDNATDVLVNVCRAVGQFDGFRIRGIGVWNDAGRIVVNTGRTLTVDGKPSHMGSLKSRYIYINTKKPIPAIHPRPLSVHECSRLIDACNALLWDNEKSGPLLAGWLATARISGALPIRPHVWITGGAGVGKSTIMEQLVANALGDIDGRVYAQGGTTEAGIRQTMKGSSMPMIFDEFETTDEKSTSGKVATIIEMFRQAWSESQGVILKGSATGESEMYSINFSALVASIRPSLVNDADKSRFSLLELVPHRSDPTQFETLSKLLQFITPEFGERLFARMIGMVPIVIKSAKLISNALAVSMGKRYGQQNGMLLAGFWALCSDEPITQELARNLVNELEIQHERDEMVPDHIACAVHLLTNKVAVSHADGSRVDMSVEEILRLKNDSHMGILKNIGIYIGKENCIVVKSNHAGINKIYKDTKWAASWLNSLRRLGHASERTYQHFAKDLNKQINGALIDLSKF